MRFRTALDFHVCFQESLRTATAQLERFDIYFRWARVDRDEEMPDWQEELVLSAESCFVRDEDFLEMIGIPLRYDRKGRFCLGEGSRKRWFPLRGTGSGGNMYWEVIQVPTRAWPHLLNYLRRQGLGTARSQRRRPLFSLSAWDDAFKERVWRCRGPIQMARLREFSKLWIRGWLKQQKENHE